MFYSNSRTGEVQKVLVLGMGNGERGTGNGERGTGLALALPLGYGEQRNVPHESEKRYIIF